MSKQKSNPQLSPDGQYLSYLTSDKKGRPRLSVRTLGTGADSIVAAFKNKSISHYQWSYLPDILLYITTASGGNQHLYALNVKTNVRRCLTPFAVANSVIAPRIIGISPCNRSEILVTLNLDNANVPDAYRINLLTGALTLDEKNPGNVLEWTADIALNIRAKTLITEIGQSEIHYRSYFNHKFGEWHRITGAAAGNPLYVVSISAMTGEVFYVVDPRNPILCAYDPRTEDMEVIFDDKDGQMTTIAINPTTLEIESLTMGRERKKVRFLNQELKGATTQLREVGKKNFNVQSRTLNDDLWLVANGQGKNTKYALFDRNTNQLTTL